MMKLKHTIKLDDNVSMDFLLEEVCNKEDILKLMDFLRTFVKSDEKPQKIMIVNASPTTKHNVDIMTKYTDIKKMMEKENICFTRAYKQYCGSTPGTDSVIVAKRFGIDVRRKEVSYSKIPRKHFPYKFLVENAEKIKKYMRENDCNVVKTCVDLFGNRPQPTNYGAFHKLNIIQPTNRAISQMRVFPKQRVLADNRTISTEEKYIRTKEMMDRENISFCKAYTLVTGCKPGGSNRITAKKYGIDVNYYDKTIPKNNFGKIFITAHAEEIKRCMRENNLPVVKACVLLYGKKPGPSDYRSFHICGII